SSSSTPSPATDSFPFSLHDALPISRVALNVRRAGVGCLKNVVRVRSVDARARKETETRCASSTAALTRATKRPRAARVRAAVLRSEEHTSELQSLTNLVCRLLLAKK